MTAPTHIAHLYVVLGDGRLNILGSKSALEQVAAMLRSLSPNETRQFTLTATEMPHYGKSLPLLRCSKNAQPLKCGVERSTIYISGGTRGLEYLSSSLEFRADDWLGGGHSHVYPAELDQSSDAGDYLVSPDSEEVLIGGFGYLPDEMFGMA